MTISESRRDPCVSSFVHSVSSFGGRVSSFVSWKGVNDESGRPNDENLVTNDEIKSLNEETGTTNISGQRPPLRDGPDYELSARAVHIADGQLNAFFIRTQNNECLPVLNEWYHFALPVQK
jgi:hypothetical protein